MPLDDVGISKRTVGHRVCARAFVDISVSEPQDKVMAMQKIADTLLHSVV
jgi:hypothetical protein